jgi:adenylate cyclase
MFTDLEGYTSLAHANESGALALLEEQDAIVRPLLVAHHGRKIKSMGDGLLLEFPNARDAVECAVGLQRSAHDHNARTGAERLRIRIGIHLGDVEEQGADILGDAVNVASRIEPLAEAGGVCFSTQVFDQVHNKVPYQIERLGPRSLKGVPEPVQVFRVVLPWSSRRGSAPSASAEIPRLAVLPLLNISPDPNDAFFADGLTEELITELSQLKGLQVIARTSVASYRASPKTIQQVGDELGVNWVIEGSVRKAGNSLRITAQLIDVATQGHAWASTYDRRLDDVFAVQSEVAKHIAETLQIKLGASEHRRLEQSPLLIPESYLAYLKGRTLLSSRWSEENLRGAKREFERALSTDPNNARAHSGLADAIRFLGWNRYEGPKADWERASRAEALRAIELDPELAEAHCTLGIIRWDEFDYKEAEAELRRALALNPSYALAHEIYSALLQDDARADEAVRELGLAEKLDPHSLHILSARVRLFVYLRRLEEAESIVQRIAELAPDSPDHHQAIGFCWIGRSDYSRALEEFQRTRVPSRLPFLVASMYALLGERDKARELLDEAQRKNTGAAVPTGRAQVLALLGDFDEAFRVLFQAVEDRSIALQELRLDPLFEPLRRDPRFRQLLEKVNLA